MVALSRHWVLLLTYSRLRGPGWL